MRIRLAIFAVVGTTAFVLSHIPLVASQESTTTAPTTTTAPATTAAATTTASSGSPKTTWDSIYSMMQASKGEAIYNEKCVRCHGAAGAGAEGPALTGSDFIADWDGLTVYQLFDRIRTSMPQDDPGTLGREETSAVLAYMLQVNGFPKGDSDLSSDADALGKIKYVATKP